MSALIDEHHQARTAFVFAWAHRAFDLLCDLEQVTAACADRERYLRLLQLMREHNAQISGGQWCVCKPFEPGRAAVLVSPRRTHVLRSPAAQDDPFEVRPPLMDEHQALAAEGLAAKPVQTERAGKEQPTLGDIVKPVHRNLVT